MFDVKRYKEALNNISASMSKLNEDKYNVLKDWSNELRTYLKENEEVNGITYVILNGERYFAVKNVSSTIMKQGGAFSQDCKGVVGGVIFKGFTFIPYEKIMYINGNLGREKKITIENTIEIVSKEEYETKLKETIQCLFAFTETNIQMQYDVYPYDLESLLDCPELDRDDVRKMYKKLEQLINEDELW